MRCECPRTQECAAAKDECDVRCRYLDTLLLLGPADQQSASRNIRDGTVVARHIRGGPSGPVVWTGNDPNPVATDHLPSRQTGSFCSVLPRVRHFPFIQGRVVSLKKSTRSISQKNPSAECAGSGRLLFRFPSSQCEVRGSQWPAHLLSTARYQANHVRRRSAAPSPPAVFGTTCSSPSSFGPRLGLAKTQLGSRRRRTALRPSLSLHFIFTMHQANKLLKMRGKIPRPVATDSLRACRDG